MQKAKTSGRPALSLAVIMPGILVAATGVGAGDLLTASIAGSAVGISIVWAALAGAVLKYVLTEGVARWQMATGTSLLEGWAVRFGRWLEGLFLVYLLCWSFFVGGALVNACGIAGTGLLPVSDDLRVSKAFWGLIHSLAGYVLVRLGGFRLFEKMMSVMIGVMFITVVFTAIMIKPNPEALLRGSLIPLIPEQGMGWLLGVIGGVGGTVTLLSYGYWIREEKRSGLSGLRACRLDLKAGYLMTGIFGAAMIVIGSRVEITRGPRVALELAGQLEHVLGPVGWWIFLLGFWGAVFSSLLGVWQSVPYLFADFMRIRARTINDRQEKGRGRDDTRRDEEPPLSETRAYSIYLLAITLIPLPLLWVSVQKAQLIYAIVGALFMPVLSFTLLLMNNRAEWVGQRFRNGWATNIVLVVTLGLFAYLGTTHIIKKIGMLMDSFI